MRRITFPIPATFSDPKRPETGPWGLADLIVERALGNPELLFSVEGCNRVQSVLPKFSGLRGLEQSDKSVLVSDQEYEFLAVALAKSLQRMAQENGGAIPLHYIADLAIYMRAFHNAEIVPETQVSG